MRKGIEWFLISDTEKELNSNDEGELVMPRVCGCLKREAQRKGRRTGVSVEHGGRGVRRLDNTVPGSLVTVCCRQQKQEKLPQNSSPPRLWP